METRSAMPSQRSPFFPTAAALDPRFTTVDIAASRHSVWCLIVWRKKRVRDRLHQVPEYRVPLNGGVLARLLARSYTPSS